MKTNIGIETNDEERKRIAASLGKAGLATRKDIKQAVEAYIRQLIEGNVPEPEPAPAPVPGNSVTQYLGNFKPSRGDEPYIMRVKDERLRELLSAMLDASEAYEQYVWDKLEQNRA